MIINTFEKNKIKLLIDESDIINLGLNIEEIVYNPTKFFKIIKKKLNINTFCTFTFFTYNYRIFLIVIEK